MEFPFKLIWTHFEMEWKMENMERNWQFCLFSLALSRSPSEMRFVGKTMAQWPMVKLSSKMSS